MRRQTFTLAAVYAGLAVLSLLLPRMAGGNETGMAASATAALVFLALAGLASLLALILLIRVLLNFKQLDALTKVVGILPALVTILGAILLFVYVLQ